MTSATTTVPTQEVTAMFDSTTRGTLPAGTVTSFGTIAATTLTAYRMADGEFVSFDRVHGRPAAATPLITFG